MTETQQPNKPCPDCPPTQTASRPLVVPRRGYPDSPRREPALYHAGVLLYQRAETMSAAAAAASAPGSAGNPRAAASTSGGIERAWNDAAGMFNKLTEAYPSSPYAGDAYVKQIDIALERRFDLQRAAALGSQASQWGRNHVQLSQGTGDISLPVAWAEPAVQATQDQLRRVAHACSLRAGLVAYLEHNYEVAQREFEMASTILASATRQHRDARDDLSSLALDVLLAAIRQKQPVTDPRLFEERLTDRQLTAIQIADLYLRMLQVEKAEAIYRRLISGEDGFGVPRAALRAYATMKLAESLYHQRGRSQEAIETLDVFASRQFDGTYWGGYGLFRLGVTTFNITQDLDRSLELYAQMIRRYPGHPKTELAHAYFCLNAARAGRAEEATRAFHEFRQKYDGSRWVSLIQNELARSR
jgi:tetratricopeptide (TPR) repeat protein